MNPSSGRKGQRDYYGEQQRDARLDRGPRGQALQEVQGGKALLYGQRHDGDPQRLRREAELRQVSGTVET